MRRLSAIMLVALPVLLILVACGPTKHKAGPGPTKVGNIPIAAGTHKLDIDVGTPGHREYLVHVPPKLAHAAFRAGKPVKPLPVVIALHGGADNMGGFETKTGFDSVADKNDFLAVYPDGFLFTWNAGACCAPARLAHIDDVGFLTKLMDHLVDTGIADPDKIFVTGFSNGGGMAYKLACDGPGRIAAIGVVSAALLPPCKPSRPVPTMIWHGTADTNVPYNGGGHQDFNNPKPYPPVSEAVDIWRKVDHLPALHETFYSRSATDCRSTGKGADDAEVVLCTIKGGQHAWPAGAAQRLWDFFVAHPRPA
jgi:polyhydroxybutyrate depolymerase